VDGISNSGFLATAKAGVEWNVIMNIVIIIITVIVN
jgi:hypothetical protein